MHKGKGSLYVLYFMCGFVLLTAGCDKLGGGRPEKINGTVISMNEAKKEIVIKDFSTGKQRTITVQSIDQMAALKPGMEIRAKIKRGATVAEKVSPQMQKGSGKAGTQKAGKE